MIRRGQRPGLDEAIQAASQADKPLSTLDYPQSDFSVDIST